MEQNWQTFTFGAGIRLDANTTGPQHIGIVEVVYAILCRWRSDGCASGSAAEETDGRAVSLTVTDFLLQSLVVDG